VDALALMAGRALAVLPADAIPDVWNALHDKHLSRRRSVLPVMCVLENSDAVPYLLDALPHQPQDITLALVDCLARMGDARALPALLDLGQSRNRTLRRRAQAALLDLERAHAISPARTLVRAVGEQGDPDPASLMRSLPQPGSPIPPEQLLRTVDLNTDDTD
jgi:HEAT repeat protein